MGYSIMHTALSNEIPTTNNDNDQRKTKNDQPPTNLAESKPVGRKT
jgi:hypothetical protein